MGLTGALANTVKIKCMEISANKETTTNPKYSLSLYLPTNNRQPRNKTNKQLSTHAKEG